MLVIFRGLPGSGKSTLAAALARAEKFALVRIDTIEQTMRDTLNLRGDMGPAGYIVGYALAVENLKLGIGVVADCVNPIEITRAAWRQMADEAGVPCVDVEVVCSDPIEHRRRVETRTIDIPGLGRVTWAEVEARTYEDGPVDVRVDTAGADVETCLAALRMRLPR